MATEKDTIIVQLIAETKDAENNLRTFRRSLMSVGLSFLFTGMAINKFFNEIATKSLTTFNKINADTEAANNTINRFSAGIESIQYALGDALNTALEPFAETMYEIVQSIVDFIDQNPKLSSTVLIFGLIASAVMMVVGQFGLFLLGIASVTPLLASLGGVFTSIFGGMGATVGIVTGAVGGFFTKLGALLMGPVGVVLLLIGVFYVLFGLLSGDEAITRFVGNILQGIFKIVNFIGFVLQGILTTVAQVIAIIAKLISFILKTAIQGVINFIIDMINKVISVLEAIINKGLNAIGKKSISLGRGQKVNLVGEGLNLSENTSAISAAWSSQRMNEFMSNAEGISDAFVVGMRWITDKLGTTQEANAMSANNMVNASQNMLSAAQLQNISAERMLGLNLQQTSVLQPSSNTGFNYYGFSTSGTGTSN